MNDILCHECGHPICEHDAITEGCCHEGDGNHLYCLCGQHVNDIAAAAVEQARQLVKELGIVVTSLAADRYPELLERAVKFVFPAEQEPKS